MLHCTPVWSAPRAPLVRSTFSPRDCVCAVAYSQLSAEPPGTSSLHCWSTGAEGSIAQKEVTVLPSMSVRPFRSPAACALCSSVTVHACVPGKFVLHAALAPGSPSVALKLKRPGVDASAPFRTLLDRPGSVVVVGPAHVPSAAQASNVLKRPREAPQALPFLHLADELTIDAFTPAPFFLRTQ